MGKVDFLKKYTTTWFPIAHVLGAVGNGIFVFVCLYEYDILLRLWGSVTTAILLPISIELMLWFFAKIGAKQLVYDEQQTQLKKLRGHIAKFKLTNSLDRAVEGEEERYINTENLILLRGAIIPSSGIPRELIYGFVVAVLVASMWIITQNRNDSNQKLVDTEIATANAVIENAAKEEIELKRDNHDADVQVIVVAGSTDNQKTNLLTDQINALKSEIAALPNNLPMKRATLIANRKALEKQLNKLPLSGEYEGQKAAAVKAFTAWKLERDGQTKEEKAKSTASINAKHHAQGTRINWLAIITNVLYCVFQYIIVKTRTITGSWSFDAIDWLFQILGGLFPPMVTETAPKSTNVVEVLNGDDVDAAPQIATQNPKPETRSETPVRQLKTLDEMRDIAKKRKTSTKREATPTLTTTETAKISEFSDDSPVSYERMKLAKLVQFMADNGLETIGGHTAEKLFDIIKAGRKCLIRGETNSRTVDRMNDVLHLLRGYEIVNDPQETAPSSPTPNLVKLVIYQKKTA